MSDKIKLWLKPYFDKGHKEHLECLFFRDPKKRVVKVKKSQDADFIVIDSRELAQIHSELEEGDRYIVACFGDLYDNMGGLRYSDDGFQQYVKEKNKVLIYLMCESNPCRPYSIKNGISENKYQVFHDGMHIILLTLPLGYLDGPKINVYYPNNDDNAFYIKNLKPNPKNYEYDWSFIGARSSWDRKIVMGKLWKRPDAWTNIDKFGTPDFKIKIPLNGASGMLIETEICKEEDIMRRMKAIHADNKIVPHELYLDICRKSRVCVSLNGWGMFSPRDGEFFSRNCFNLRQDHENLGVNVLTPEDGVHWIIFKNDEFEEKLQYYIENSEERERINDTGHEYFKRGISGEWAKYYVDALEEYLLTGHKRSFAGLMVMP